MGQTRQKKGTERKSVRWGKGGSTFPFLSHLTTSGSIPHPAERQLNTKVRLSNSSSSILSTRFCSSSCVTDCFDLKSASASSCTLPKCSCEYFTLINHWFILYLIDFWQERLASLAVVESYWIIQKKHCCILLCHSVFDRQQPKSIRQNGGRGLYKSIRLFVAMAYQASDWPWHCLPFPLWSSSVQLHFKVDWKPAVSRTIPACHRTWMADGKCSSFAPSSLRCRNGLANVLLQPQRIWQLKVESFFFFARWHFYHQHQHLILW